MTLVEFIRLTRANLWRFFIAVVAGAALAYGYAMTLPKVYAADASGYVTTRSTGSQTAPDIFTGSALAGTKADSYLPLVNSRAVGERVAKELNLKADAASIAARLTPFLQPSTVILRVTAVGPTPQEARDVADAAIRATAYEASRLEMGGTIEQGQVPFVRIIPVEIALLPVTPISPNMKKYGMLGGLGGLGLAYAIVLGRRLLDTRLRSAKDVETFGKTTSLGIIPQTPELRAKEGRGKVGRLGAAAEGFRQLRTNLRFVSVDNPPRSIVVTSANPSEGKSTVSSTLARVLGEAGQPTIIIDADLRRPTQATIFERDGSVGLSQLLSGQIDVEDALQDTDQENVRLIPAGRIPPNPSELLGSQRMKQLLEQLSREHLIILDAPPLLPVTDAGLLSGIADGTLLVFAVGKTHKEQIAFCTKVLDQVGGNLLGAVLNLAPKRGMGAVAYGNGYYGYGYGYGDGYRNRYKADGYVSSGGRRRKAGSDGTRSKGIGRFFKRGG